MVLALLIVSALRGDITLPDPPPCQVAQKVKHLNLPPGETSDATDINHAVAVLYGGKPVGWLYQTFRGQLFYQDGPIGTKLGRQSAGVATAAIQALGLKPSTPVQHGAIYTVIKPLNLAPIADKAIELKGCY